MTTTPEQIGLWIAAFFALGIGALTVVWLSRQIWMSFNPQEDKREGHEEYVTRGELNITLQELKETISGFVSRHEYETRHSDLGKRVDQLNEYMHQRIHDVLNGMNSLVLKMDLVTALLHKEIGRREGQKFKGDE